MKFDKILKIRKSLRKLHNSKNLGVSPIIATVMILALVVSGVVIGFLQILPYIEQSKVETGSASIQSSLIRFDNTFWDLIGDSAGNYFPDSVPSRKIQLSLPIGAMENDPTSNNIIYEPMLCTLVCPATSFPRGLDFVNDTYGALRHSFSSTYALIPENSLEYLTGSNPYQRRTMVAYSSLTTAVTDEQSSTNMTLYREGSDHYIELSYRAKIFVTQTIENGLPTYNIGIFLIKLNVASSFIGITNVFIKLTGTSIDETNLVGKTGESFQVLFSDGSTKYAYATYDAFPGGFTTYYKVTTTIYEFSISE